MGIDPDPAVNQAADARPLVTMQIGASTWRKGHAVATHQQFSFRQRLEEGGQLFVVIMPVRWPWCFPIPAREFPASTSRRPCPASQ